jgi:hypothetical protein
MNELMGNTEAEFFMMNSTEQQETLLHRRTGILQEMETSHRVYEREQKNLQARLEAIDAKLREIRGVDGE